MMDRSESTKRRVILALATSAIFLATACVPRNGREPVMRPPKLARLSTAQIAQLIKREMPASAKEAWANAVVSALDEIGLLPTPESVCAVLAVIEQESSFRENPQVPNLAKIVSDGIDQYASRLGPLGGPLVRKILGARTPGQDLTFDARFKRARTERDVDRVFRELVAYYEAKYPKSTKAADLLSDAIFERRLADYNPITTAGSMQVSVRFARERARERGQDDEAAVREELYTLPGGVRQGVARLLGYEASYDAPIYRFADYNAGVYASRNAAVQEQLAAIMGTELALDGDLLIYEADGTPSSRDSRTQRVFAAFAARHARDLNEHQIRKDLRKEKSLDFEATDTYRALRQSYRSLMGRTPVYARIPTVELHSPKLSKKLTTEWFARSVDRRCNECLARAKTLR